jgi:hypothetical protein
MLGVYRAVSWQAWPGLHAASRRAARAGLMEPAVAEYDAAGTAGAPSTWPASGHRCAAQHPPC